MVLLSNLPLALNAALGSFIIVILILVNYARKYNTDRFLHRMFSLLLIFTLSAMVCDIFYMLLDGLPGGGIRFLMYAVSVLYYLLQILSFFYVAIFIDYMVFKQASRTKKIVFLCCTISVIHALVLLINWKYGFYFHIDGADNHFHRGEYYFIRIIIALCPLLFILAELVICYSSFKKSNLAMFFTLICLFFSGSILDLVFVTTRLLWPLGTAALLYAYFFIVQSDTRVDPLTGIGNRFSFNEFTDRLSRHNTGESWAIVMIDMDHFKAINDTLGHQAGDVALCSMAAILKSSLRGSDFAARYGGDEFVLTTRVEKGREGNVDKMMGRVQTAIDNFNAENKHPFKLEISYGYDTYTQDGKQPMEEFLSHIDTLMYKHKQERRRRSSDSKSGAEQ